MTTAGPSPRKKCDLKALDALYALKPESKTICDAGIIPGDYICCDVGTLPYFNQPSNADGKCKHVLVDDGDNFDTLAKETCEVTTKQFIEFNGRN